MMPAAVMVATVADPVASRISTATTQASSSGEMLLPAIASPMAPPIPVSTSTCLKPPPAATMSSGPAIGGSEVSNDFDSSVLFMPVPTPRVKIATTTAISSATSGVPMKSSTL